MKYIAVYCSSSNNIDEHHFEMARELGTQMAKAGVGLVYGGGSGGLMGALARGVHEHGGHVVGIIPQFMDEFEGIYRDADQLLIVDTMRQRKAEMEARADAFVVLPGGIGTLEEITEILTLKVLRQLDKPIILLSYDGFYEPFIDMLTQLVEQHFAKPRLMDCFQVAASASETLAELDQLWASGRQS